jgi:hypothetical protein
MKLILMKIIKRGKAYDPKKLNEPCKGMVAAILAQPLGEVALYPEYDEFLGQVTGLDDSISAAVTAQLEIEVKNETN